MPKLDSSYTDPGRSRGNVSYILPWRVLAKACICLFLAPNRSWSSVSAARFSPAPNRVISSFNSARATEASARCSSHRRRLMRVRSQRLPTSIVKCLFSRLWISCSYKLSRAIAAHCASCAEKVCLVQGSRCQIISGFKRNGFCLRASMQDFKIENKSS